TAALHDAMVTTTTPGGQRVLICTCTRTGRHLATFTRRPGSSVYTLATEPPQVTASAQVSASGQVAASCSCRLLSHQTLLWHHRLGHPSLPRLRGMHSRLLVSGLPRFVPPLAPSPALPCLPCVEGWQCAAPHSSFPLTTAPMPTLHMDVWGPTHVSGQGRERFFLLVVDDYTRYTTVFPLRSKSEVFAVFIPWIRIVRLQLRERFGQDFLVLRLDSDRGAPHGLVMEVPRTSMIPAAAPHFLWLFAVRYAAHQLNLWPHVSLPETSPTLRWTGKVGHASVFWVWGSRAFVRDTSSDKLFAHAIPCVFLGFVLDAPGWQFYLPTSRRVLPSQDVTFDESIPFYRLFPYRSAPSPPPPLFLAPGPPPVDPLPPQGPAPSGVSQVDPLPGTEPIQVAVVSGASPGAASESDGSKGAESKGAEPGGAESGGAEPRGAASSGGPAGASPRLSSQQLREWLVQRAHRRSGAPRAGEPGDAGAGGASSTTGAGDPTESGAAGAGGAGAGVVGAGSPGTGGAGASGAGAEMASWKSAGTYVDEVPPPGVNIVDGMWIFRVKHDLTSRTLSAFWLFHVAPDRHGKVHWDAAKRVLCYLCSTSGMGLVLGGRGPVVLTGHADSSWVDDSATQWSSQGYTFSLGSGSVSWRSTRSSSALSSSCGAEIYAGAMAAQELCWLTYLLTNLGEQPRSPPVLYVDNKAMIALCQDHRLEHRTKQIALRYFLARELQQRGQLRLAYVATRANTADVFTKALPPGDHQRFVTVLGLLLLNDPSLLPMFTLELSFDIGIPIWQRGQLRLAYVATRANTADVFTKALPPGDHQRFVTVLGLVPTLPHLLTA
ncbi:unnamed protein product, partial [Closterium sp. NIES-53]